MSDPTKTLLIVDDDPMVRDVEAQVLRLQGYTVLEAQGAADALRLAREAAAIHLLITDFSMPEVDGLELTRRWTEVAGVAVSAFVYYRKRDFGRNEFSHPKMAGFESSICPCVAGFYPPRRRLQRRVRGIGN